ncbi:unnamed protein product [Danaus chrysippus]|uniref:(African queen) hypothetical protein n=1 Tax=Danaus chrysippus TaxID=151541 RepID=A0A8J2RGX3_9NEOP|nr:unnamed protein product [Danaus chrysippus]
MDSLANSDAERRKSETDVIEKCNEEISTDQTIETPEKDETKDLTIHIENVLNDEKTECDDKEECPDTPVSVETPNQNDEANEITDEVFPKPNFTKRFSVDYKKNRIDIKRYSIDCSRNVTLDELASLEQELARTNVGVRLGPRRKSSGILKSTSESMESCDKRFKVKHDSASDDDEVFEKPAVLNDYEGPREPPATPVGRDELALRRHRFFSDLVCAARAAVEHRVRFDPLGPVVADSGGDAEPSLATHSSAADLESLIERLERVTSRLERLPVLLSTTLTPPSSPTPLTVQVDLIETDNMSINGYQELMQGPLQTYLQLSNQLGGDIATHANLVNEAFQEQLRYIQLATTRSKPSQAEDVQLLGPTSVKISSIQQFREKNRASKFFNHLSAISESIPALGWVAVSPTPAPYVKEMNDAGQFYTNRVLKEWKEKDKTHVEWCRAWIQLLSDLQAYVKQYHTTGLVWSGKGGAPPPPPGGMPPPPPALPEVDFANMAADDRSALFAEINKGEAITSSLRKVTSDMQTHKNPQLRQGPAPFKAPASKAPVKALPTPGAGSLPDKPPVFARDGKKWVIEYQKSNQNSGG